MRKNKGKKNKKQAKKNKIWKIYEIFSKKYWRYEFWKVKSKMKKASDYNWIALNDIEQNSWDSLRFKGKFCCLKKKSKIIGKKMSSE